LYGLAQTVYEIILTAVIRVVPSGAAGFKWMIVHRGARVRAAAQRFHFGSPHENASKNRTNCGDETCEITGLGS
jgi:hypothetical protein